MKKKIILFFLLPLLCFVVFIAYCYVSVVIESNKKYYFPQIETYLKVYKPPFGGTPTKIFKKQRQIHFLIIFKIFNKAPIDGMEVLGYYNN